MAERTGQRGGGVQSLDRAFALLELMAAAGGDVALSELAARLRAAAADDPPDRPHPGRLRLRPPAALAALRAGPAADRAGRRRRRGCSGSGPARTCAHLVERAARPRTWRCSTATRSSTSRRCPRRGTPCGCSPRSGARVPPHCTRRRQGAARPAAEREVRALLAGGRDAGAAPRTPSPTRPRLPAELDRVRDPGYAVDDAEQELGVRCVAVAVAGSSTSAVSVSGPASRVTCEAVRERGAAAAGRGRRPRGSRGA